MEDNLKELLAQIQKDIINTDKTLYGIMLKSRLLADNLKNDEFTNWVKNELDGYKDKKDIPDYRRLTTYSYGTFRNMAWQQNGVQIPLGNLPKEHKEVLRTIIIRDNISGVEKLSKEKDSIKYPWPVELVQLFNMSTDHSDGYQLIEAYRLVSPHIYIQILDTIRNRLLELILKLNGLPWDVSREIPSAQVNQLIQIIIQNKQEGDKMAIFDQRGQSVSKQYNAAHDINFGDINKPEDISIMLENILGKLAKAFDQKQVTEQVAVDAEYQIKKAIIESKDSNPPKETLLSHIGKAQDLLKDFTSAVELVTAIGSAIAVIHKIL